MGTCDAAQDHRGKKVDTRGFRVETEVMLVPCVVGGVGKEQGFCLHNRNERPTGEESNGYSEKGDTRLLKWWDSHPGNFLGIASDGEKRE